MSEQIKAKYTDIILRGGRGYIVTSINKTVPSESTILWKNALFMWQLTRQMMFRYTYFLSLLIKEIDNVVDSLVDKEQLVTDKSRKVHLFVFIDT